MVIVSRGYPWACAYVFFFLGSLLLDGFMKVFGVLCRLGDLLHVTSLLVIFIINVVE